MHCPVIFFFFFGLLWKLRYFQFKNLVGKSAKCYLFVSLWKLWFLMSRHPLPDVCFGERGWAALPAHGRAQGCLCVQPQHAAAWDPAQVHQPPCSCRGTGMVLDASTDPALGKSSREPVHPPRHPPCCIWVSVSSCLSFGAPTCGSWGYGDATALIINRCLSQRTPSGKWSAKA